MSIHFVLLLVVMLITFLQTHSKEPQKNKKACVIIVTVILTLFSGFKSWWYGDLIRYYTSGYRASVSFTWSNTLFGETKNHGLLMFFKLATTLGISYEICLFLIAAFIAICVGVAVYKFSPSPYWSYLMFIAMEFYGFTFSGLKQTVATGFCFIAFHYIIANKKWKFLLFVLLAVFFHAPAAIFLLAYPIAKKKIDRYYFLLLGLFVIAVFVFRNQIVDFISDVYYNNDDMFVQGSKAVGGRALMMVFILVFALFMRKPTVEDKIYSQLFNMMVFAAVIQTFSVFSDNFSRLADYYYIFVMLFMPLLMESGEHQAVVHHERTEYMRYNSWYVYLIASVAITVFSLIFYYNYISNNFILSTFKFFWEINPYSLYGT